jgi:prepilin-type N-terminal cleavage/methylation domain-containing protein
MSNAIQTTRTTHHASENGFSLIEVLLALTILSVGMLGSGVLSMGVMKANGISKGVTVATALAQDGMEAARTIGYSGLPSADATVTEDYDSIVSSVNGNSADYSDYKRVTAVLCDTPAADMKTVTISVHRRAGRSPVVFTTVLAS